MRELCSHSNLQFCFRLDRSFGCPLRHLEYCGQQLHPFPLGYGVLPILNVVPELKKRTFNINKGAVQIFKQESKHLKMVD